MVGMDFTGYFMETYYGIVYAKKRLNQCTHLSVLFKTI